MYASILDIGWSLLFQIINFCILLFFLSKFLYNPINKMFEARKNEISENLSNAEKEKRIAESLKSDYEVRIKDSKMEAENIINNAVKNAQQKSENIVREAVEKAKLIEEKAAIEIETQKQKAFNDLKSEISVISIQLASKILEKDIKQEDQDRLINDFINNVGDKRWKI